MRYDLKFLGFQRRQDGMASGSLSSLKHDTITPVFFILVSWRTRAPTRSFPSPRQPRGRIDQSPGQAVDERIFYFVFRQRMEKVVHFPAKTKQSSRVRFGTDIPGTLYRRHVQSVRVYISKTASTLTFVCEGNVQVTSLPRDFLDLR